MYKRETCPTGNEKYKFANKQYHDEMKHDYTSENKRMMKTFFKILDKNELYMIKYFEKDEEFDENFINTGGNNRNLKIFFIYNNNDIQF